MNTLLRIWNYEWPPTPGVEDPFIVAGVQDLVRAIAVVSIAAYAAFSLIGMK